MYESFFGLRDLPFRLTPDPKYLFMSAKHREAFAHLVYGISEGSGFVAITGEVGAGKTTLIRALLAEHAQDVTVASIVNPVLTSTELLQTINAELGLPSRSTSRKELLEELAAFLRRNKEDGRRTVIIVDEAQNLDPVVLEQLRLLSNLETETEKLLQIVLVGQPELHGLLQRHDLRQLNQRVTERWHLDKLDRDEAIEYVRHRLRVAGAQTDLVDPKGLELLYRYSDGVPRLLNILAHRSLLVAYTRSRGRASTEEVAAAARELGYAPAVAARRGGGWGRLAAGLGAFAAAALVAFLLLAPLDEETLSVSRHAGGAPDRSAAAPAPPSAAPPPAPAYVAEPVAAPATPAAPAAVPTEASPAESVPLEAAFRELETDSAPSATPLAALAEVGVYEGAVADYSHLLELWGAAPVEDADVADGTLDLSRIAVARGLRYFATELNLALLSALDLPAMLELRLPGETDVRYVLVHALDASRGTLVLGADTAVAASDLEGIWNRKAHILWRDTEGLSHDLGPGSGGPAVRKLQAMLGELGLLEGGTGGLYDDLTETAVRLFQEQKSVHRDGVAGPITQILLYNSLGRVARPTLALAPVRGAEEFR